MKTSSWITQPLALALLFLLSTSTYGQAQPYRYLKKGHWDGAEAVGDRPGFKGEWINDGTMPWATPESEFADQRDFVHSARCAFQRQSQEDERTFESAFAQWKDAIEKGAKKGWTNGRRLKTVVIPTYFHVITDGSKGDISEQMIENQMQVLNDAFEEAGFRFLLMKQGGKSASRTNNKKWHQGKDEFKYKARLRKGGKDALNIYCNEAKGYLGFAYYPSTSMAGSVLDGVVILYSSVPGGWFAPYNLGDTLVHEVGHWLGLAHTFTNGCSSTGDFVADTPAEREPAFGCPIGRDTCQGPGFDGSDPVQNYMDYSDDSCMDHFTAGQVERMHASYDLYRGPDLDDGDESDEDESVENGEPSTKPSAPPSAPPSASPSNSPVAATTGTCDAAGAPCSGGKKNNNCCSSKCKKDKKTKRKTCK